VVAGDGGCESERTRVALAAKKAQGALLGNRTNLAEARAKGRDTLRNDAAAFAANVLRSLRRSGKAA
jgi:hypothetical protein